MLRIARKCLTIEEMKMMTLLDTEGEIDILRIALIIKFNLHKYATAYQL